MATKKISHLKKNKNLHIAHRIVDSIKANGPTLATELGVSLGVSTTTVRAISNGLIRAGILYRTTSKKAVYALVDNARSDAFFCKECNEWNDLDLINSHGDCRLCGAVIKPLRFSVGDVTKGSKLGAGKISKQEEAQFAMAHKINNLQMSM